MVTTGLEWLHFSAAGYLFGVFILGAFVGFSIPLGREREWSRGGNRQSPAHQREREGHHSSRPALLFAAIGTENRGRLRRSRASSDTRAAAHWKNARACGTLDVVCRGVRIAQSSPLMSASDSRSACASRDGVFHTTRWSLVLRAEDDGTALGQLCESYWYPLYCCVRRHGQSAEDAQDLTQGFFAKLLRNEAFADADPVKGRFRTWLLRSLEHYLRNEHRYASAEKRGGGVAAISWDAQDAEERYAMEPGSEMSPERMFERQWAQTMVYAGLARLRREFAEGGKGELFDELEPHLWSDETSTPYATIGERLQMTVVALRVTVHRLRRRFHDLLREEIATTVERDEDIEDELAHLQQALANG